MKHLQVEDRDAASRKFSLSICDKADKRSYLIPNSMPNKVRGINGYNFFFYLKMKDSQIASYD